MPYLPGLGFLDSVGNALQDSVANPLQEADEIVSNLMGILTDIYNDVVDISPKIVTLFDGIAGSGVFPPATWGWSIAQFIDQALNGPYPYEDVGAAVLSDTYGLSVLQTQIADLHGDLAALTVGATLDLQDVIDAIPASGLSPEDVWGYQVYAQSLTLGWVQMTMGELLLQAGQHAIAIAGGQGYTDTRNPYFTLTAKDAVWAMSEDERRYSGAGSPAPPSIDWSTAAGYTDIVTFLNDADPAAGWGYTGPDGVTQGDFAFKAVVGHTYLYWRCLVSNQMLPFVSGDWASSVTASVSGMPPTFPGIANVTLGTPVALSSSVTVPGPLDGVLVEVTTPPSGLSTIVIGGYPYHYRIGEIAFLTDDGQAEPFQYLGFEDAVYLPRQLVQAAGARLRVMGAASGTATPFTINP